MCVICDYCHCHCCHETRTNTNIECGSLLNDMRSLHTNDNPCIVWMLCVEINVINKNEAFEQKFCIKIEWSNRNRVNKRFAWTFNSNPIIKKKKQLKVIRRSIKIIIIYQINHCDHKSISRFASERQPNDNRSYRPKWEMQIVSVHSAVLWFNRPTDGQIRHGQASFGWFQLVKWLKSENNVISSKLSHHHTNRAKSQFECVFSSDEVNDCKIYWKL